MVDTTVLGTDLLFSDVTTSIEGFAVVSRFGIQVGPGFSKNPSPSHIAINVLLPTCNQAALANSGGFFDGTLLLALAYQETLPKFNPRSTIASSPTKIARGMGQFLYETGKRGVKPPILDFYNPADSLYAAASFLKTCYLAAKRQSPTSAHSLLLGYACMGYNGGPGTKLSTHEAGKYNIVDGKKTGISTKMYAQKINQHYRNFAGTVTGPMTFK